MNKLRIILHREFIQYIGNKAFILSTVGVPLLIAFLIYLPKIISNTDTGTVRRIAVLDETSELSGMIVRKAKTHEQAKLKNGEYRYDILIVPIGSSWEKVMSEQRSNLLSRKIDAVIRIPADVYKSMKIEIYAHNVSGFSMIKEIIRNIIDEKRIKSLGVTNRILKELKKEIRFSSTRVSMKGEDQSAAQLYFLVFSLSMVLYFSLIIYGTTVMRNVIEEKSSRIAEIIVSSTSPGYLLSGKILGVVCAGLIQYIVWIVAFLVINRINPGIDQSGAGIIQVPHFSIQILIYFVLFFLAGFFQFSIVFAAIGSMVSSSDEANQLSFPLIMMAVVPILLMSFLIKHPDADLSVILSIVPFFAPQVMFMRVILTSPPALQIVVSIVVNLGTITILTWLASRIYRIGILHYGKRPSASEIFRWLKHPL